LTTTHPTSRAVVHGTRNYAIPRVVIASIPRKDRRRCLACDCQLYSGNEDELALCWSCKRSLSDTITDSDEQEFRLIMLVRLVVEFGEPVDLAEFFETTDRGRIHRAVKWWRKRGAKIVGLPKGGYKIVGWDE